MGSPLFRGTTIFPVKLPCCAEATFHCPVSGAEGVPVSCVSEAGVTPGLPEHIWGGGTIPSEPALAVPTWRRCSVPWEARSAPQWPFSGPFYLRGRTAFGA